MTDSVALQSFLHSCLCPAGNGVHTVNTGKDKRARLQQQLYQSNLSEEVNKKWQTQLQQLPNVTSPMVLGICSDAGGGILRGANWGPLAVRDALYANYNRQLFDLGDIRVIPHLLHDKYLNTETLSSCRQALYHNAEATLPVSPLSITESALNLIYQSCPEAKIFSIGGDHSISYACCNPFLERENKLNRRTAVLHFDAHTDLMDKRLGIDFNFATWAYAIIPQLKKPNDLIQVGIRSTRYDKAYWEKTLGVQQHWAAEVIEHGAQKIADNIIQYINHEEIETLYVSFDIDAIDSTIVSSTGTPEPDGITPEDAILIIEKVGQHCKIAGADMMEVAPYTGVKTETDRTVAVAAEISQLLLENMPAL